MRSVNEAAARAKLGQWPQVSSLLQASGGVFQVNAEKIPADDRVVRGQLLLADALLRQNKLGEAAEVLHSLASQKLAPELNWQQAQLLCHVQLAGGDTNAALASTTNLIRLANLTGQPGMRAESVVEQGSILEEMGRTEDALEVYQGNLSTNVPAAWQRQAILKIAELAAAQTNFSDAGAIAGTIPGPVSEFSFSGRGAVDAGRIVFEGSCWRKRRRDDEWLAGGAGAV